MSEPQGHVRLALRVEGQWWVAYMAKRETMDGAIELGRILLNAAKNVPDAADRWKLLMRDVLGAALLATGAQVESWGEEKAPESERSGRA